MFYIDKMVNVIRSSYLADHLLISFFFFFSPAHAVVKTVDYEKKRLVSRGYRTIIILATNASNWRSPKTIQRSLEKEEPLVQRKNRHLFFPGRAQESSLLCEYATFAQTAIMFHWYRWTAKIRNERLWETIVVHWHCQRRLCYKTWCAFIALYYFLHFLPFSANAPKRKKKEKTNKHFREIKRKRSFRGVRLPWPLSRTIALLIHVNFVRINSARRIEL